MHFRQLGIIGQKLSNYDPQSLKALTNQLEEESDGETDSIQEDLSYSLDYQ